MPDEPYKGMIRVISFIDVSTTFGAVDEWGYELQQYDGQAWRRIPQEFISRPNPNREKES